MRILIKLDTKYSEELEILALGASILGHQVAYFDRDTYRIADDFKPECIIFSSVGLNTPDTKKYISENPQLRTISLDELNLDRVANTQKFRICQPDSKLKTDICIINTGNAEELLPILNKEKKQIKICGSFINSPFYIGTTSIDKIVTIAKSSKLTICSNNIIKDSLLFQNICTIPQYNLVSELIDDIRKKEAYILKEKQSIKTERYVAEILNEKLRNINR